MAHVAALPALINEDDAVVFDQQVHQSVQTATNLVRVQGSHVELLRHSRIDLLEERIEALIKKHRHVWYLADGVYSMFGDLIPFAELQSLLERYEQFHLYVDDAHGVGWFGEKGRGYFLDRLPIRDRMVVALSLNKSFAAAGGVLVFPNEETKLRVRYCGGPMIFSGPVQPPMLGAAIASAELHLSDELKSLQEELHGRIALCNRLLKDHHLPVLSSAETPIRFVGVGLPRVAFNLAHRLMDEGFFVNAAQFPAVPMRRSGIRFTLTRHQRAEDIKALVEAMDHHLPLALEAEGSSLNEIERVFKGTIPGGRLPIRQQVSREEPPLRLLHERTIQALDPEEWDGLLGKNGGFTWQGLRLLEKAFQSHPEVENNWNFHYFLVRDPQGTPVLATFFTEALWKDDMLSPANTSILVERHRQNDPYLLTTRTLAMGSLLTEGNHLFLDREKDWKGAMELLLKAVESEREQCQASRVTLRDLPEDDKEMDDFLLGAGFSKFSGPETLVLDVNWQDEAGFLQQLTQRARKHQVREVLAFEQIFQLEVLGQGGRIPTSNEVEHFHQLYQNVKGRNFQINTFDLPKDLWERMCSESCFELLALSIKPEFGGTEKPVGFYAALLGAEQYVPVVTGLDYDYVFSHHTYRFLLYQVTRRALLHQKKRIFYGFGAPVEKKRLGAKPHTPCLYLQMSDHYNAEVLSQLMADSYGGAK